MTNSASKRGRRSSNDEPRTPKRRGSSVTELSRKENMLEIVTSLLWFWGSNCHGQMGFGEETTEIRRPTPQMMDEDVLDVAAGGMHTVVLMTNGTVWSFGLNDDGALGRPTSQPGAEEGDPTVPGEVAMFRETMFPVQVVCTNHASFILTEYGEVYGCGTFKDSKGVLGFSVEMEKATTFVRIYNPNCRASPVKKLIAGGNHVIAILEDGGALSWGNGEDGQLGRVSVRHSRRGNNPRRNMLTPRRIGGFRATKFVDASCGKSSTFLQSSNGQFFGLGDNRSGQLAMQPNVEAPHSDTLDLEERVRMKTTFLTPTLVEALEDQSITSVATGKEHSLGINKRGRVYSWGSPSKGVLGREEMIPHAEDRIAFPSPRPVTAIEEPIEAISCGQANSGCINSKGRFYTWGAAQNSMLGADDDEDLHLPRKMQRTGSLMWKKWHKLTFGGQHVALLGQMQR